MAMSKRAADARFERAREMIQGLLTTAPDIDDRLSQGHLHALVVESLGAEPLVVAATIIAMSMDARSKIQVQSGEAAKLALAVHDRIYGPPDIRLRKKPEAENQFELEFAWATPEGPMKITAEGSLDEGPDDDGIV